MKKIIYHLLFVACILIFNSCETDNFDSPEATIQGRILDHNGKLLEVQQGNGSMRIKMEELSWSKGNAEVAIIPTYLNIKQDGTYVNTKIFSGEYRMTPIEGPFYPYDEEGDIVTIKGTTTKDFTVTPYLDVEWVSEPTLTADRKISCSVRFKRNGKDGKTMPDLLNARIFVSRTPYAGANNNLDQIGGGTVNITNDQEGQTIHLTSEEAQYSGITYWVRIGICCNVGDKKYNYTDIKTVEVK